MQEQQDERNDEEARQNVPPGSHLNNGEHKREGQHDRPVRPLFAHVGSHLGPGIVCAFRKHCTKQVADDATIYPAPATLTRVKTLIVA